MTRQVLSSTGIEYDPNHFNSLRNEYELRETGEVKYPKSLLAEAEKLFIDLCKSYHIDQSAYPFVRIMYEDPTWQVDFHTDHSTDGTHISIYNIYFARRKILQSEVDINGWGD